MNLRRVNITLNDVENRDVGAFFDACINQDVLSVQQTSHHIKDSGFPDGVGTRVQRQRRVTRHQKVTPRGGHEGSDQAHEVVVHVARVSQSGGRRSHDGRDDLVLLSHTRVL